MAELKYLPAGIRLHLKEIIYKFTDDLSKYYYFHFEDIPTGLKAEKILKEKEIEFKSIPVPDDIFEKCGVSILVDEYENIRDILKSNSIEIEVFEYKEHRAVKIYSNFS